MQARVRSQYTYPLADKRFLLGSDSQTHKNTQTHKNREHSRPAPYTTNAQAVGTEAARHAYTTTNATHMHTYSYIHMPTYIGMHTPSHARHTCINNDTRDMPTCIGMHTPRHTRHKRGTCEYEHQPESLDTTSLGW